MSAIPIKRALISVSNKDGLVDFARALAALGVEILSTGGTSRTLKEVGIAVKDVSDHTGFPEIMDGRVKTLHPKIHGGFLARRDNEEHLRAMAENDIAPIDMLVVNLYPFVETVRGGGDFDACIENIDIGGPAMIRAAAKNHEFVSVLTDPEDYADVLADMKTHGGGVSTERRRVLAAKAYARTAAYDTAISEWFAVQNEGGAEKLPPRFSLAGTRKQSLRYGENPHQDAALYLLEGEDRPGPARAAQIQGKELSYNNINDTDAAFALVADFEEPALAIIKHANPCGVATGKSMLAAYERALACDPVSAFGGIIALNRVLDGPTAEAIIKVFSEVIIAPSISAEARVILATKPNIRVLETGGLPDLSARRPLLTRIAGGFLVQDADIGRIMPSDLKVVTKRAPSAEELADMIFAFRVAKHTKSNAIIYAKNGATVGIGAGQMSRVDSARIAAWKAQEAANKAGMPESMAKGSVVASDAFFPFADGLISAADAGVTALIQPGGSIRDEEVIAAADERNLAMVFTGMRHFRH
ncbi:MAG: bifunctional phosphoribosylaminoimidazolecarboxamide formyltransferase/IMP cyclohydrolase [Alphaproteobacteria bacterium]|nr:bifunctional phosphoribosylaminoimidazolecarboxamide formyltransferase/IMP cyclohydrolase [Alphaproteobacteria bacterium]